MALVPTRIAVPVSRIVPASAAIAAAPVTIPVAAASAPAATVAATASASTIAAAASRLFLGVVHSDLPPVDGFSVHRLQRVPGVLRV
ncbi:hypothetical protein KFY57_26300, partial [Salmonella enterica subsp. enterica serovar Typhimurium]|nr:hypothetical protein [Salmonella enterica subsp. enterica serovar Typhimurium]